LPPSFAGPDLEIATGIAVGIASFDGPESDIILFFADKIYGALLAEGMKLLV
jgi:hypothetical protein